MKTIGMLGGMSWESTALYYVTMNRAVQAQYDNCHSASLIIHSLDFQEIVDYQKQNNWDRIQLTLSSKAKRIEEAGADCLVIASNTAHKVAGEIEQELVIPILHIADAAGDALVNHNIKKAGLLGTIYTMNDTFYSERIEADYGIELIRPAETDREIINWIIYDELCRGQVTNDARNEFNKIIRAMVHQGAEGILLACTELSLLKMHEYIDTPTFDSARIHAQYAAEWAMRD